MSKRKVPQTLLIIAACLVVLSSCFRGGSEMKRMVSPSNKTILELSTKNYDDEQLFSIAEFSESIDELNRQYPVECLREMNKGYRATYLGHKRIAVIIFDRNGERIMSHIYSLRTTKEDYNDLNEGGSIDDVITIDPEGEYLFLYSGRNDIPKRSYHYTKDGFLLTIEYDNNNTITNIRVEYI